MHFLLVSQTVAYLCCVYGKTRVFSVVISNDRACFGESPSIHTTSVAGSEIILLLVLLILLGNPPSPPLPLLYQLCPANCTYCSLVRNSYKYIFENGNFFSVVPFFFRQNNMVGSRYPHLRNLTPSELIHYV